MPEFIGRLRHDGFNWVFSAHCSLLLKEVMKMRRTICSLVAAAFLAGHSAGCKSGHNDDGYIFIDIGVPNAASRERLNTYFKV